MTAHSLTSRARTNRKFSLLGACGLLAITVIQLPNLVDLWDQARSQNMHRSEMLAGISAPQHWAGIDEQRRTVESQLEVFEQSMVDVDLMPTIQSELMELVRSSGCQLRKVVIQAGSSEDWKAEQLDPEWTEDETEATEEESGYTLTTEQLNLSLTGSLPQTFDFLQRLQARGWLMRVAQINFSRDPETKDQLLVEASLAFYKLQEKSESERSELVQWRDGSRANQVK